MFRKLRTSITSMVAPGYIVKKIHNEFDTASERLLAEAKEIIAKEGNVDAEMVDKLSRAGFTSCKIVSEYGDFHKSKLASEDLALRIAYYEERYPSNKFITHDEVKRICKKYALVCGAAKHYIGTIPARCVDEIRNSNIDKEDVDRKFNADRRASSSSPNLHICAPLKEFKKGEYEVKGNWLMVPKDPIVLQPVIGGFLVVTKWGVGSDDPALVNQKMN